MVVGSGGDDGGGDVGGMMGLMVDGHMLAPLVVGGGGDSGVWCHPSGMSW